METKKNEVIQVRIFQMPEEERNKAWVSIQELREVGLAPDAARYHLALSTEIGKDETLSDLYDRYHFGIPGGDMRKMQVGDVIMFEYGGKMASFFVDPFGFKPVPEMTAPLLEHNRMQVQQQTHKRAGR